MLGAVNRQTANSANHRVDARSPYTSGACATPSCSCEARLEHQRAQVSRVTRVAALVRDGALEQTRGESAALGRSGEITTVPRSSSVTAATPAGRSTRRISVSAPTWFRTYISTAFAYTTSKLASSNGSSWTEAVTNVALSISRSAADVPCRLEVPPSASTPTMRPGAIVGREVECDAADAAADVEDVQPRAKVGQQEREEPARVALRDVPSLHRVLDHVALIDS